MLERDENESIQSWIPVTSSRRCVSHLCCHTFRRRTSVDRRRSSRQRHQPFQFIRQTSRKNRSLLFPSSSCASSQFTFHHTQATFPVPHSFSQICLFVGESEWVSFAMMMRLLRIPNGCARVPTNSNNKTNGCSMVIICM